uniref:Uncharacterized protein n=1 Tax=Anguilla anguilla TaxID=7936 RepID=A0A0E9QFI8_ANGAN
MVVMIVFSRHT